MSDGGAEAAPFRAEFTLIRRAVWPLLLTFIFLGFADILTTLIAYSSAGGFVELNSFAAPFFRLGFTGFMLAEFAKCLPVFPLAYMISLRTDGGSTDLQVGLLKIAAFVVLLVADAYLAWVVFGNNIPGLISVLS